MGSIAIMIDLIQSQLNAHRTKLMSFLASLFYNKIILIQTKLISLDLLNSLYSQSLYLGSYKVTCKNTSQGSLFTVGY